MVSERDSLERINALASDVESGGTCYITACTNPQTKVNSVNLFDAQRTGRATPVAKMEEHTKGLMRVAVRDGTDSCLVASGDKAGIVKLWDPRASAASFKTCVASPCFFFFLLPSSRYSLLPFRPNVAPRGLPPRALASCDSPLFSFFLNRASFCEWSLRCLLTTRPLRFLPPPFLPPL